MFISGLFIIKIIDLDTEISTEKIIMAFVFEIDSSGFYRTMTLIN